jgi:energy-converting hydrogenase Eha subunit A
VVIMFPRPIISGGFSPIGRKVLKVMTGAAAVGRVLGYVRRSTEG